jgi:hypothetical protein
MSIRNLRSIVAGVAASASIFAACSTVGFAQDVSALPYVTQLDGAKDPQSIPSREAIWAFFTLISGSEDKTPGRGEQLLKAIGLNNTDAAALFRYIRASVDDAKAYAHNLTGNQCQQSSELKASVSTLVNALQSIEAALDARRDTYVAGIADTLSESGYRVVTDWVDAKIRPALRLTIVDHQKRVELAGIDPNEEVDLLCRNVLKDGTDVLVR